MERSESKVEPYGFLRLECGPGTEQRKPGLKKGHGRKLLAEFPSSRSWEKSGKNNYIRSML